LCDLDCVLFELVDVNAILLMKVDCALNKCFESRLFLLYLLKYLSLEVGKCAFFKKAEDLTALS